MKQLQKTDFIREKLRAAVGPDVDIELLPVYEVTATSTVPLRGKTGTMFENAVIVPQTLEQLAAMANNDPAPLMQDHIMTGSPKGKFFYGEVRPQDSGQTELRSLIYADPGETDMINKMDNSTIDEVSIAFLPEKMNCSMCGFDYMAELKSGNPIPMLMRECDEGHAIGKDGAHVFLNGVSELLELSVVSRGAAKNSRIVGQSDSILGKEVQRLAASGLDINQFYVTASAEKGFEDMDLTQLVAQLSDTKADLAVAKRDRETIENELAKERGRANEAEARATELESELRNARDEIENLPTPEARKAAEENKEAAAKAGAFLTEQYVAVLTAAGKTDITAPDSIDDLIDGIKEHKAELSAILPIGGRSVNSGETDEDKPSLASLSAFKLRN